MSQLGESLRRPMLFSARMAWVAVGALAISNFAAIPALRDALVRGDKLTALLTFCSFFSSFFYHGLYDNARGVRNYSRMPLWLFADRIFAVLYALRLLSMMPPKSTYVSTLPIAIPAAVAGVGSELFRGSLWYAPLHTAWHLLVYATAGRFARLCCVEHLS